MKIKSKFKQVLLVFAFFPIAAKSQITNKENFNNSKFVLDTIKDYRIKIDGGCSFYSLDTCKHSICSLVFVISANNVGFISLKDHHDYVYLKRKKLKNLNTGEHQQVFAGDGFTVELTVKKTGIDSTTNTVFYKGKLIIKNNKFGETYIVKGRADNR